MVHNVYIKTYYNMCVYNLYCIMYMYYIYDTCIISTPGFIYLDVKKKYLYYYLLFYCILLYNHYSYSYDVIDSDILSSV